MINDYMEIRNAEGMPRLIDSNMALGLLLNSKNNIRNLAIALSETASSIVRKTLRDQLEKAIDLHGEITDFMINKEWFYPMDLRNQFKLDIESSTTLSQIAALDLFPGDTSRLGIFATPNK